LRTYHELDGEDRSGLLSQVLAQRARVAARLAGVRFTVAVMSGKGGVGKSFVTAGLAGALARAGRRVGVLDADLHGPTTARMLAAPSGAVQLDVTGDGVRPVTGFEGVRVMSSDLLLAEGAPLRWREPDQERFVWRGTLEAGMLREFLSDVAWGALDVLLIDLPPGTERLDALIEFVPGLSGVVAVTIPSVASLRAVRRAVEVARGRDVPILGVVENMAGTACHACGAVVPLFHGDAGAVLAGEAAAPVLARVPFDARLQAAADDGAPPVAALREAAERFLARLEAGAAAEAP
jgi:ATP-binding protein involved in chromosome partitioning